jgi:hypothetical protein
MQSYVGVVVAAFAVVLVAVDDDADDDDDDDVVVLAVHAVVTADCSGLCNTGCELTC